MKEKTYHDVSWKIYLFIWQRENGKIIVLEVMLPLVRQFMFHYFISIKNIYCFWKWLLNMVGLTSKRCIMGNFNARNASRYTYFNILGCWGHSIGPFIPFIWTLYQELVWNWWSFDHRRYYGKKTNDHDTHSNFDWWLVTRDFDR